MKRESSLVARPTKPFNYAIGMFGTSIPINMFKTFAFIFYVDHLSAITAKEFAAILFIYTIVDAIDNPVYGYLSDITRSPWGRRRPWLVIGTPLLALCFIMFFNVPSGLGEGSVFWYALVMYVLTGTLDSLINSNYGALFPELFKSDTVRAKTNAMRQAFQLLAMVLSVALTPMITEKIGYRNTSIIYSILAVAVILYMTFNSHEDPLAQTLPKPSFFRAVFDIIQTPKFWLYGITNAACAAGLSVLQQSVSFYGKYVLKSEGATVTILLACAIVPAIFAIPVWVQIVKKIGLMPSWRLSFLVGTIAFLPLYFADSLLVTCIILCCAGFAYGGMLVSMDIVAARILDEDFEKHGIQREGTFSSLVGVLNKSSGLFAGLAFILVSQLYGYESGDVPGARPDDAARFLISIFPFFIMGFCTVMSFFIRFDDEKVNAKTNAEAEIETE